MKLLTILLLCCTLASTAFAQGDSKAAIASAAEKYVAANSAISKVRVTVDKVEGNFARAKATPSDSGATDAAWVFLKKQNGSWTGLTLGTAFSPEDYRELGIPRSLWIK
jgi:hypothetical protein